MRDIEIDLAWLRHLSKDLWREYEDRSCRWGGKRSCETRRLTEAELARILDIIETHRLPTTMRGACFGFGCGMLLWEPEPAPLYPGADVRPDPVLFITQDHLPLSEALGSMRDRTTLDDGWRVFSPFTHSAENVDLLRRCGLPESESRSDCEY
jgi:hypothetical protein